MVLSGGVGVCVCVGGVMKNNKKMGETETLVVREAGYLSIGATQLSNYEATSQPHKQQII